MYTILPHSWGLTPPTFTDIKIGDVAIWLQNSSASLYTKSIDGGILPLNIGVTNFADLEDVDVTNISDKSFFIYDGITETFTATNTIGSINILSDVETTNITVGDTLVWDSLYNAFVNKRITFNLYELTDVDVYDDTATDEQLQSQNNHVLVYDYSTNKYILATRKNNLYELDDTSIPNPLDNTYNNKLLVYQDSYWQPITLDISWDTSPTLGGDLDANQYSVINHQYKTNTLTITQPEHTIEYTEGSYWVIKGSGSPSVINIDATPLKDRTIALQLEIHQDAGLISLAGLTNVFYEDGYPIELSGEGGIDIVSIIISNNNDVVSTYISLAAVNLATSPNDLSRGKYLYDTNEYIEKPKVITQQYYDNYALYNLLVLQNQPDTVWNKTIHDDKSLYETSVVFNDPTYTVTHVDTHILSDFTIDWTVKYTTLTTLDTDIDYITSTNLSISYTATTRSIDVTINGNTYVFYNINRSFINQLHLDKHFALVRYNDTLTLYVDGLQYYPTHTDSSTITLTDLTVNSDLITIRLTEAARYTDEFTPSYKYLPYIPGAYDIHEDYVFDTAHVLGEREVEHDIFSG